jgi:hypothetical protein
MFDPVAVERVEKSIDEFINARSKAKKKANEEAEFPNFLGDAGYLWRRPIAKEWEAAVKEIRSQIAERREHERRGEAGEGGVVNGSMQRYHAFRCSL